MHKNTCQPIVIDAEINLCSQSTALTLSLVVAGFHFALTEQVKWLIAAHHVDSCEIVFINTIAISDVVHPRKIHNCQFNEMSIHVENNRETRNSSSMYYVEALCLGVNIS